jgi:hypothetical protein
LSHGLPSSAAYSPVIEESDREIKASGLYWNLRHDQDKENFFKDLAREFKTTLEILAKVNGRPNLDPVSRQNLEYLLVPRPGSRGAPGVDRDMGGEQPRGVSLLPLRLRPLNSRP